MTTKEGLKQFVLAIREQWFAAMSGSVSVPFAILAAYMDDKGAKIVFTIFAIVSAWFAAYRVWKVEREKANELAELLRPKLSITFEPRDPWMKTLPRSNIPDTSKPGMPIVQAPSLWFRVEISTPEGSRISHGCQVHLQNVEYSPDGVATFQPTEFGSSQALRWAEDTVHPFAKRDIVPLRRNFVDLASTDPIHNAIHVKWAQNWISNEHLFTRHGVFRLSLVVSSDDGGIATARLLLSWNGVWSDTTMRMEPTTEASSANVP